MMRIRQIAVLSLVVVATNACGRAGAPPAQRAEALRCEALAASQVKDGEITLAKFVPQKPGNSQHPDWPIPPIPAHCRLALTLRPSVDSEIRAEIWLPVEGWNGRFLGVGVGGFGGVINEGELKTAVQRGYAAGATDTGHGAEGTDVWARGHREKIIDFGHRAIHEMTVAGKELTARYFGQPAHHAYFSGCSNGGRQALMEALRYPNDYDGIIAGAPAADFVGLIVGSFGWNFQTLRQAPFPSKKLPALQRAVLAQCDALDGASDGLVGAPEACRFQPSVLACGKQDTDDCLSSAEISALTAIYRGPTTRDGRTLYPGFSVGGEAPDLPSPGWEGWIVPSGGQPTAQFTFFHTFMRDFVVGDSNWSPGQFQLERDIAAARNSMAPLLNADDPDLGAFAKRGGKLIVWHGWSDQAIPALATLGLYERIRARMGNAEASDFSRLYMVPGMQHCWLGPGPWSFNPSAAMPNADPRSDMAAALEAWVEEGKAPGALTAIRPKNAYSILAGFPPLEVERSGLLCPFPLVAKYDGKGMPKVAASYSCAASQTQN